MFDETRHSSLLSLPPIAIAVQYPATFCLLEKYNTNKYFGCTVGIMENYFDFWMLKALQEFSFNE